MTCQSNSSEGRGHHRLSELSYIRKMADHTEQSGYLQSITNYKEVILSVLPITDHETRSPRPDISDGHLGNVTFSLCRWLQLG